MRNTFVKLFVYSVLSLSLIIFISCKDKITVPEIETLSVIELTHSSALISGEIINDGGNFVCFKGFCYGTDYNPTISDSKIVVESNSNEFSGLINGLESSKEYYVRAFASNSYGASYGQQLSFVTSDFTCGESYHYEGYDYNTIEIGGKCWFTENLRYLPRVAPAAKGSLSSSYYYVYDYQGSNIEAAKNTESYKDFGALYNWHAAIEACPAGWFLPSDEDWKQVEIELGMSAENSNETGYRGMLQGSMIAGMSEIWNDGPLKGTPLFGSSGLDVIPAGYRSNTGIFNLQHAHAYLWSSTDDYLNSAWTRQIFYFVTQSIRYRSNKEWGLAVRCVKEI
jgi:uncharacterized protein (TIGR02145 family)